MARPKKSEGDMTTRSFRLTVELDAALKDVAAASGQGVTNILVGLVAGLIDANRANIDEFRRRKDAFKVKPTFAASPAPKSARTSKTKAATIEPLTLTEKAGDDVAQDD